MTENLRHPDKRVRLASSECLGKIGALDPSYLPKNVIKEGNFLNTYNTIFPSVICGYIYFLVFTTIFHISLGLLHKF